jgi:hypothetical protein
MYNGVIMKTTLHRYTYLCGAIALGLAASPVLANSKQLAQSHPYQISVSPQIAQAHSYRAYDLTKKTDVATPQAYFVMKDDTRIFGNVLSSDDGSYTVVGNDGQHVFKSSDVKWFWYTTPPPTPLPFQGH